MGVCREVSDIAVQLFARLMVVRLPIRRSKWIDKHLDTWMQVPRHVARTGVSFNPRGFHAQVFAAVLAARQPECPLDVAALRSYVGRY